MIVATAIAAIATKEITGAGPEEWGLLRTAVTTPTISIAAILGELKAGKFYVPLESTFPNSRLTDMLDDSRAGLIVTKNRNLSLAKELTGWMPNNQH